MSSRRLDNAAALLTVASPCRDSAWVRFRSRIQLRVLLAIATAFGLSSTIQGLLLTRVFNEQPMLGHIFILNTVYWYVPALLAPFIMELAERFPVAPGRWRVSVPVHVAGALVYS